MRQLLFALLLLAALAPAWPAAPTDWTLTVNDSGPYVGDEVVFTVSTTFPIYRDYVLLEIRDPLGQVMDTEVMQLDGRGRASVSWESPLQSDPGNYEVTAWFRNSIVANLSLDMVFDEMDYLIKRVALQDKQLGKQELYNRQTRAVSNAAYNRADYYILRIGVFTFVLDMVMLLLVLRIGLVSAGEALKSKGDPASGFKIFWRRAFSPQVGGNFMNFEGHEDMIQSIPEHARGSYCSRCRVWVHEGEAHEHTSPPPPASAPARSWWPRRARPAPPRPAPPPPPAAPARAVVPRRIVRRRVAAPPPEMKVTPGVGR